MEEAIKVVVRVESRVSRSVTRAERAVREGVVERVESSEAISLREACSEGVVSSRSFFSFWRRSRSYRAYQHVLRKHIGTRANIPFVGSGSAVSGVAWLGTSSAIGLEYLLNYLVRGDRVSEMVYLIVHYLASWERGW